MQLWSLHRLSIGLVLIIFLTFLVVGGNGNPLPLDKLLTSTKPTWGNAMSYLELSTSSDLTRYLRAMHSGHTAGISSDFGKQVGKLGDAVHNYTENLLQKAAASNAAITNRISAFKIAMDRTVLSTARLRAEVQNAIHDHGLTLNDITAKLSAELDVVSNELKAELPPLSNATHHEQRLQMVSLALSKVEVSIIHVFSPYGVLEVNVRARFKDVSMPIEQVLVATGDLIEQHPALLETLLFSVAILLVPEVWFLRPFLSLFGFGPYGPIKGSSAAWAQRRFWGAAVAEGSWFSRLQAVGMKIPNFPGIGGRIIGSVGFGLAIVGSLFARCR